MSDNVKTIKHKPKLIVTYYHREGPVEWDTHLKLYMGGWEAHPSTYVFKEEIKYITPKQALIKAIKQWKKTTNLNPISDNNHFSVMISKAEEIFVGLKTVSGKEIREYLNDKA